MYGLNYHYSIMETDSFWQELNEWNVKIERQCASHKNVPVFNSNVPDVAVAMRSVRCRKCKNCLKIREYQWSRRAAVEYLLSPRTWWITLTYADHLQNRNEYGDFLPPTYEDVKLYFKRLRKQKHEFRYVISEERGDDNERLHWHILMHCEHSLTRRKVEGAWSLGHVHPRLAHSAGLGQYLAKYLAKQSRIRASKYYGDAERALEQLEPRTADALNQYILTGETAPELTGIDLTKFGVDISLPRLKGELIPF